jgi:hypothetical protein
MEAVHELLTQLRAHTSDEDTVHRLCTQLRDVLLERDDMCAAAGECGAVELMMQLLQAHAGHTGVQAAACAVVGCVCRTPAHARAAAGAGVIEAVVSAMRTHAQNGEVQGRASGALCSLMLSELGCRVQVSRAGGAEVLVAALRTHVSNPTVLVSVLYALLGLVQDEGCTKMVSQQGGVLAVVAALDTHPQDAGVQQKGCNALNNMVFTSIEVPPPSIPRPRL